VEEIGKCMICGTQLFRNRTAWVCSRCAKQHDLRGPFRQWPAWAKDLAFQHKLARKAERVIVDNEADAHIDEDWQQALVNARLMTGGWPTLADLRLAQVGELSGDEAEYLLPYRPYGDKGADRIYREANNVTAANAIDFEPRSQMPTTVRAQHRLPQGSDGAEAALEIDWFVAEHADASGRIIPARYELRGVRVRIK
jgi:hypothetical protein